MTGDDDKPKPNKHGVTGDLSFDHFDEWTWDDQDAVTNISAKAARLVIDEIIESCEFNLSESDEGITVEMWALDTDLVFAADLLTLVRDFMKTHNREIDRVTFRRVLTEALALLGPEPKDTA